jgi:four helix bundle protein
VRGLDVTGRIRTYKDLVAWQKAFQLGTSVYRLTRRLPGEERYGLSAQLRRGAVAIASNIAEGYGRGTTIDYLRFLRIARGALYELETQLMFADELDYLDLKNYEAAQEQLDECERVLAGLIRSLSDA